MSDDPDRFEKCVRFGFGAFLGFFLGLFGIGKWMFDSWPSALMAGGAFAVIFGLLAMTFGNRFWRSLGFWHWFWP